MTEQLKQAAQAALEALEHDCMQRTYAGGVRIANATIALRVALAQPTQPQGEPVAWICRTGHGTGLRAEKPTGDVMPFWTPLYTTPQRVPQPLTPLTEGAAMGVYMDFDRRADKAWTNAEYLTHFAQFVHARAIETAHGIGAAAQPGDKQ
jgi:hypothetical protein